MFIVLFLKFKTGNVEGETLILEEGHILLFTTIANIHIGEAAGKS